MLRIFLSSMVIFLFSVSAYAADAGNVVAKVNGTSLTQKDLDRELDRLIPRITFHRSVPEEKRKMYYDKALEELINQELEYQDAVSKGMKIDKEKVDAEMEKIKNRFKSQEDFKTALERSGITEENLRKQVEKSLLIQAVYKKTVIDPSQVSEKELKEYYDKNKTKFKQPESVKLSLISAKEEKKAKDILAKIKAGGDFGDLAYKMSEDDYRVKSGDIGYVHKGRMLPELEDVAFKLKVGQVSDLIKAGDYWYIIRVEDKKPEHQMSFDESKDKLKKDLEADRLRENKDKWITELRAKAKIEVLLKTNAEAETKK
jgi:parvulin-like peptidyl-prolyl isomerase